MKALAVGEPHVLGNEEMAVMIDKFRRCGHTARC